MQITNTTNGVSEILSDDDVKFIIAAINTVRAINQVGVDINNDKDGRQALKVNQANKVLNKINALQG